LKSLGRLVQRQKGNSLIELMIIVVIMTILAISTISYFVRTTTRAKQYEAKRILKQIYQMQRVYHAEYGTYWKTKEEASAAEPNGFARIGVIIVPQARYSYMIDSEKNQFTARAVSKTLDDDEKEDIWTMDQDGRLSCLSDDSYD
jgi:Tfp pilus assembly protein PilE